MTRYCFAERTILILLSLCHHVLASTENLAKFRFMPRVTIIVSGFVAGDFNEVKPRKAFADAVVKHVNISSTSRFLLNYATVYKLTPPSTKIMFQINCGNRNEAQNISNILSRIHVDSVLVDSATNRTQARVPFKMILNQELSYVTNSYGKRLAATKIELLENHGIIEFPVINTTFLYSILSTCICIGFFTVIISMRLKKVWDPLIS